MKRVLITGGDGMLGSAFAKMATRFSDLEVKALGRNELDVCDSGALAHFKNWIKDGWIVHCAARVDVEGCAREPEAARAVIVEGTRNVARLAADSGGRLFYPQSFLIYDGARNPIPEDEMPRPLSFYGELKYEAERLVEEIVDDPLIVRMAGFFGGEERDKNFVGRIIPVMKAAMDRGETQFDVGDRVWQPTWTNDLATNSLELMAAGVRGHYQMACHGQASFAQIAREIVVALGWSDYFTINSVDASKVSQSELGRRPDVAILSCQRLTDERRNVQKPWIPALHAYLQAPFFDQFRREKSS